MVFGVDDALEQVRERLEHEDGEGTCITIAPDHLHKADTSGGEGKPYEIGLSNLGTDAEILNERQRLLVVASLRPCFRFGGFSGCEGIECGVLAKIKTLGEDRLAFWETAMGTRPSSSSDAA